MAYFAPFVSSSGLSIPSYTDILNQLIADAKTIFGNDIYLGTDSMDYQFISVIAAKIYDAFQLAVLSYNNRSPSNAIGTGLDSLIKINGLSRIGATYSSCAVTITGTAGTSIVNGIVQDISSVNWALPALVTIPLSGSIIVTATCISAGPIVANIGDISKIVTPTYGWTSVTNATAAVIGASIETDAQLRSRQAISTAKPSLSRLEGTKAAIAGVAGVTRSQVYENDTNSTNSDGLVAHSIAAVVEGGTDLLVATAIFNNKCPGTGTQGATTTNVTDSYGAVTAIKMYRPTYVDIDVQLTVKALTGYTTDITTQIKANIAAYLSALAIGADVSISSLWGAALTAMPSLYTPLFSITALTADVHGGTPGTSDIVIAYNAVSRGNVANITVTVI